MTKVGNTLNQKSKQGRIALFKLSMEDNSASIANKDQNIELFQELVLFTSSNLVLKLKKGRLTTETAFFLFVLKTRTRPANQLALAKASAPATISKISVVIAAWRAWL